MSDEVELESFSWPGSSVVYKLRDSRVNDMNVDSALSSTSTNPVQNKVINSALEGKADTSTTLSGYGITDAKIEGKNITLGNTTLTVPEGSVVDTEIKDSDNPVQNRVIKSALESKADSATTLEGYGITDAKIENGVVTLGTNSITPITDISGKSDKPTELTQAQYDALSDEEKKGKYFIITDAAGVENPLINDSVTTTDTVWSSSKVNTTLNGALAEQGKFHISTGWNSQGSTQWLKISNISVDNYDERIFFFSIFGNVYLVSVFRADSSYSFKIKGLHIDNGGYLIDHVSSGSDLYLQINTYAGCQSVFDVASVSDSRLTISTNQTLPSSYNTVTLETYATNSDLDNYEKTVGTITAIDGITSTDVRCYKCHGINYLSGRVMGSSIANNTELFKSSIYPSEERFVNGVCESSTDKFPCVIKYGGTDSVIIFHNAGSSVAITSVFFSFSWID